MALFDGEGGTFGEGEPFAADVGVDFLGDVGEELEEECGGFADGEDGRHDLEEGHAHLDSADGGDGWGKAVCADWIERVKARWTALGEDVEYWWGERALRRWVVSVSVELDEALVCRFWKLALLIVRCSGS